jgi:hypothetical protein
MKTRTFLKRTWNHKRKGLFLVSYLKPKDIGWSILFGAASAALSIWLGKDDK